MDKDALTQFIDNPDTHPWVAVSRAKESRDIDLIRRAYKKEAEWRLRGGSQDKINLGNAVDAASIAFFIDDPDLIERAKEELNRCAVVRSDKTIDDLIEESRQKSASLRRTVEHVLSLPQFDSPSRTTYEEYVMSDSAQLRASSLEFALELGDIDLVLRTAHQTYLLLRTKLMSQSPEYTGLPENPSFLELWEFLVNYNVDPALGFNNDDYRFAEVAAELAGAVRQFDLQQKAGIRVILMCLSHEHLTNMASHFGSRFDLSEAVSALQEQPIFADLRKANKLHTARIFQRIGREIGSPDLVRHGKEIESVLRSCGIELN